MSQLPVSVYYVVGILVLANLGTIITVLTFIFKAGKWVGQTDIRLGKLEQDANAAHEKIRFVRGLVIKNGSE